MQKLYNLQKIASLKEQTRMLQTFYYNNCSRTNLKFHSIQAKIYHLSKNPEKMKS